VLFLEKDGEPIGFALALPDVNQALRHANGRLFPLGWLKLLYHARRIHKVRVLVLGLLKEYRGRGLDILLYLTLTRNGTRKGYSEGEFSWILEDNTAIRRPLERIGARVYKTYRFYEHSTDRA
jgi:GNAT superfamily N-acetyltransferase